MATKAKESKQVKKVRQKLEKVLEEEHSHFTNESLREMKHHILHWITRHEPERMDISTKTFKLFDENHHPSEVKSKFVNDLLKTLKEETVHEERKQQLRGRVRHHR